MTDKGIPLKGIGWEPTTEGVQLSIGPDFEVELNLIEVRELAADMQEAAMLSRRVERLDIMADDVEQHDKIYVAGNVLSVSDVQAGRDGTVLQFGDAETELVIPDDQQITVYRSIE